MALGCLIWWEIGHSDMRENGFGSTVETKTKLQGIWNVFFFLMENTDKNDSVMVKPLFKSVFAYKSPRT